MAMFYAAQTEPAVNHEPTHTRYYTVLLVTVLIVPLVTVCILQTVIIKNLVTLLKLRNDEMGSSRSSTAGRSTAQEKEQKSAEDVCYDRFGLCIVLATFYRLSISRSFLSEFNPTLQFKLYNIWSVCLSVFIVSLHSESM